MWAILLDKIFDTLNNNTSDNKLQEVYKWEADDFKGSPACTVVPSDNRGDYYSTSHNERLYSFSIKVFADMKKHGSSNADRIIREALDKILDDFDKDYLFTGLNVPTGYTMVNVFAAPSQWGYSEREQIYRVGEVVIQVRVHVDITAIS